MDAAPAAAPPRPEAAARSLALLLAATGGGRDLADFSNRVWRHLHQRRNLPPDNPQLRAYQRNLPTLIAERARHVLALVAAAQAEGTDDGAPHLARDAWPHQHTAGGFGLRVIMQRR